MRIVAEVANRIRQAAKVIVGGNASGKGYTDAWFANRYGREFALGYERREVHKDMHRMDTDDGVMTFALNAITFRALGLEDVTLDSFEVSVESDPETDNPATESTLKKARSEIRKLNKRVKAQTEAVQITRKSVKFGNEFREVIYDPQTMDIIRLKPLPEQTVWPVYNAKGDQLPGYIQRPDGVPSEEEAIKFSDAEIIHFAFGEIDGGLGTPLMKSSRRDWKRLNLALDSTARARLIRAFMKLIHRVPVNSSWDWAKQQRTIEDYKSHITQRPAFDSDYDSMTYTESPMDVATDLFLPDDGSKRGGVEAIDPENSQLQNIKDIEHFLDRFICATHVPKRYFPFEGSTPKLSEGGGNAEDKQFACLLVICQNMLKQGFSKLYDLQLAAKGIPYDGLKYVYRMAEINTTDQLKLAQTQLALGKTMEILLGKYPELREHVDVMFREYSRVSAANLAKISEIKLEKQPDPVALPVPNPGNGNGKKTDTRTTLPAGGTGSDNRAQV